MTYAPPLSEKRVRFGLVVGLLGLSLSGLVACVAEVGGDYPAAGPGPYYGEYGYGAYPWVSGAEVDIGGGYGHGGWYGRDGGGWHGYAGHGGGEHAAFAAHGGGGGRGGGGGGRR